MDKPDSHSKQVAQVEPPVPVFGFSDDETLIIGPPSRRTARGWAYAVDKALKPPGKSLRDTEGRLLFTRADFLRFNKNILGILHAHGLTVNVSQIPWGAFAQEESSEDREADWERLSAWLEER